MGITNTHERYANFYTDFAFKKLFGSEANKECLISFLNALLEGKEEIRDLSYLNVEHLSHAAAERKAVFDVLCENEKGEKFLIEMQKAEQQYFVDRSIYYSSFLIQEQAPQGKWNFQLSKVYAIGILNFEFDRESESYLHHEVKLCDTRTKEVFYDKLTYIYLEMPKFHKTEAELETLFDKWLYAIKNLYQLLERPAALQDAVFNRFFEAAEIANFTPTERRDYQESQKDFWDLFAVTETAEMKGIVKGRLEGEAIGLEKGLAEGRAEGRLEGEAIGLEKGEVIGVYKVAKNLKTAGSPVEFIMQATGLSREEIEKL